MAFVQPYAVAATLALLGIGFWFVYRRPRPGAVCNVAQQRRLRWLVWAAAVVVVVMDLSSFAPNFFE